MPKGYRHLTYTERCRIEAPKGSGFSRGEIARHPGRDRSTIHRELGRNGGGRGCRHERAQGNGGGARTAPARPSSERGSGPNGDEGRAGAARCISEWKWGGDTVIGTVRPGNGSYAYISRSGLTGSTGFAVLSPKNRRDAAFVYFTATDPSTIEALSNLADGGASPAVRPVVVATQEIVVPDALVLNAFASEVMPLIERIEAGKRENQTLARLRDTLLPRLMSGAIRVGKAREQAEAAT